jgi:uncharacterized protein (TIGR03032 family)
VHQTEIKSSLRIMPPKPSSASSFSAQASRGFEQFLKEEQLSLVLTSRQANCVLSLGIAPESGRLWLSHRTFDRPSGVDVNRGTLALATHNAIVSFTNTNRDTTGAEAIFVPRTSHFTGALDVHDVNLGAVGPLFVNTLYSCVARTSDSHSFCPVWVPPFVDQLRAEDRCHLNGLATQDGHPTFATAIAQSNLPDAWRDRRFHTGVVIDIETDAILAEGMAMPHSPRWHDGRLWVLDGATGAFGHVSGDGFTPLATLPGFARGMALHRNYAVVGTSIPRQSDPTFGNTPIAEHLAQQGAEPRCSLQIVNIQDGTVAHWLRFSGFVEEIFDVAVLPDVPRAHILGPGTPETDAAVTIEVPQT